MKKQVKNVEVPAKNSSRRPLRLVMFILAATAGMLVLVAGAFWFWMQSFVTIPAAKTGPVETFNILHGQNMSAISRNLKDAGLVSDALRFKLYARYKRAATHIKTGEYELSATYTPARILSIIVSGKVKLHKLTVPEGFNMMEIADLAEQEGFCSRLHFLALCRDPEFVRQRDLPGPTMEGYLYPDTYFFEKSASCRKIIIKMSDTFKSVFTEEWKQRAQETGFTVRQIVTLASMIEKETGNATERPLISSVFHNRLERHMRLESDPTVIYDVKDYYGKILYRHLRRKTPYNTYQIPGLPIGPIANPGADAIRAALYPADSKYLFFVSKNDTTHKFSTNLEDHNRAVRK